MGIKKLSLLISILILWIGNSVAIDNDSLKTTKLLNYDTNYITSYYDWFHVTLVGVNKQSGITLSNIQAENDLTFSTNNPFGFGLAFDYEWFTFEYTKSFKAIELTDKKKGQGNASSMRFGLTGRKFRFETYYRISQGFSLETIEDFVPDWFEKNEYYPYFEDLNSFTFNLSLYYTFNYRKYSNTAALWQLDRQIKSAGSPVIGMITNLELITSEMPLTLNDTLLAGSNYLDIKMAASAKLGLTGGYMHTFSIKKRFYIHGALLTGFLYNNEYLESHADIENKSNSSLGNSIYFRLTAGYNANRIYGGIFYVADSFSDDVFADKFKTTTYSYFRVYVGYRFYIHKKPWMKKLYL